MKKTPVKISVQIELSKLDRNISRAQRASGKGLQYVIEEAAKMFTQSAAIATPPIPGKKNVPQKMWKRPIVELLHKGRKDEKARYLVKIKRPGKPVERKYFPTRRAAKNYESIDYRVIGKAGWWMNLSNLAGGSIADFKAPPRVMGILSQLGSVSRRTGFFSPEITIANKVKEISRYGSYAAVVALRKTNIRMAAWLRKLKNDTVKTWA